MRDFLQNCCRKRNFFRYLQSERRQEVFPGRNSSAVEHFTRNEGVPSSNLGFGSKIRRLHRRMRPLFRMWQEALAGFAPICRLPKDDCGTPRRPILCEPAGHTRIRTATSRVGRHAGNVFRISVSFPPGESAASLYACFYLKEFDCPAVVSHEEEDPDRRSETEIPVRGLKADRSAVQTPQGGSRAREIPATGGRRHIVVWQTTNPLISKKSGPRVAGIQAVSGEGLAPRGSVPLRRKAGGSRADRQLSAACVAEYGVRRFKTDAHPALHTICRKRKI